MKLFLSRYIFGKNKIETRIFLFWRKFVADETNLKEISKRPQINN